MAIPREILLSAHDFTLGICPVGGAITQCGYQGQPIMRDYSPRVSDAGKATEKVAEYSAAQGSSYPLVPFGNRIADNHYDYGGQRFSFKPNNPRSDLVIHGSGLQQDWHVIERSKTQLKLALPDGAIGEYLYSASQTFTLADGYLTVEMEVTNRADKTLLFGLGFHPYFYRTDGMKLQASCNQYWEIENKLPKQRADLTADIDFNQTTVIPEAGLDNGFEGWDGEATIEWPQRDWKLQLTTEPKSEYFHLYTAPKPGQSTTPASEMPSFCFEPMTHLANGFHHPKDDYAGLKPLQKNESMRFEMKLAVDNVL